ncbi:MAG: hypothetical protein WBY53_15000 [Acidobacteriaceae bacterium]
MQLSEELRDQLDQQITAQQAAADPSAQPSTIPAAPRNAIVWRGAIQTAGLAGAIAGGLALLTFALPPVSLLSFLWFVSAPIVVLGIYSSRFRQTRVTTGFGARLGFLTGLAMLCFTVTLNTIGLVLQRFVFHSTTELDSQLKDFYTQMHTNFAAKSPEAAKVVASTLAVPEFRAGLLLSAICIALIFYLIYAATAGAFGGYLRSRAPRS